jgi:hypothetical protein
MDKADRRAAIAAYKERPPAWGVFAVRCGGAGPWVGASRHLDTQENSIAFALRIGGYRNRVLQAAWSEAGAEAFHFEVLEQLPADTPAFRRTNLLKERLAAWREQLDAPVL